jgi:hypothetical protein
MTRQLRKDWQRWGTKVRLKVIDSPYREVVEPLKVTD